MKKKTRKYLQKLQFEYAFERERVKVTFLVFSGRDDPQWFIQDNDARYKNIKEHLDAARGASLTYTPDWMNPRLGYKGFLVQEQAQEQPVLIIGSQTKDLQSMLYKTLPPGWLEETKLEKYFEDIHNLEILTGKSSAVNPVRPPRPLPEVKLPEENVPAKKTISVGGRRKRYAYRYTPSIWNTNKQLDNNCYNFANNKITDTFAQPGRGSGAKCLVQDAVCMRNAAVNDHLEFLEAAIGTPIPPVPSGKKHLVALYVNPGIDFHFYQMDQQGLWTHKPGRTQATDLDNANQLIFDPRNANRNGYNMFGGFMLSNRDEVTIA
ncbi:unnamed protein product [Porites evermanni]|uniref:Uncharacterized protein n=1 Tax=Porites evermanni TaxID=104178 RepID=A0ABN8T2T7_9CNID|nr:unnamed protein product [Porites evermanni]